MLVYWLMNRYGVIVFIVIVIVISCENRSKWPDAWKLIFVYKNIVLELVMYLDIAGKR